MNFIANIKLTLRLCKRKATRLIESERVKAGQLAAQRKQRANDPMRRAQ